VNHSVFLDKSQLFLKHSAKMSTLIVTIAPTFMLHNYVFVLIGRDENQPSSADGMQIIAPERPPNLHISRTGTMRLRNEIEKPPVQGGFFSF
jgi:hypothetical protein